MKISNFKFQISNLITHPLFSGSAIMIFGSNMVSFLNYLFHLVMGRLLGPVNYGELASIISLTGLLGVIPLSLNIVIIKYISSSADDKEVGQLINWFQKKVIYITSFLAIPLILLSPFIAGFLNIKNSFLIIMATLVFIISLVSLIYKSALQGLLKFREFVISLFLENSTKLIIGIALVYMGFKVFGAVSSLVLSAAVGILAARFYVKDFLGKSSQVKQPENIKEILLFALPVTIQSITTTALYSNDVILVKHFFSAHDAGIYASLSTLGKIIFFAAAPIGSVMFPFVAKRHSRGEAYHKIFLYSLALTVILSLLALMVYWQLPNLIINLLYGKLYLEGANLLIFFGLFMTFFTLSMLFINLNLSLGRTWVVILPLLAAIVQAIAIWLFHTSLESVVIISLLTSALLLLGLIIYSNFKLGVLKLRKPDENKTYINNSTGV